MSFGIVSFLGAFLFFALQPFAAKALTPRFGGGSHVWLTCMLFFQGMLLAGYGYAHVLLRNVSNRLWPRVHMGLLLLGLLSQAFIMTVAGRPLLPGAGWMVVPEGLPALGILKMLLVVLGLPALILAASAPLAQAWYERSTGRTPYRLYALSNAGSLTGLLAYPFLAEPFLSMNSQAWILGSLLLVYSLFMASLARKTGIYPLNSVEERSTTPGIGADPTFRWIFIALCSTFLLMSVTNALSTELQGVPLLWVMPLVLYLITFILAFEGRLRLDRTWAHHLVFGIFFVLILMAPRMLAVNNILGFACLLLPGLFAACLFCHCALYALRPPAERLSRYYLAIATGGVLGGILASLLAPILFSRNYEFHLALSFLGIVAYLDFRADQSRFRNYKILPAFACLMLGLVGFLREASVPGQSYRDAYGIINVHFDKDGKSKLMFHGRTVHGAQIMSEPLQPIAYSTRESGIGRAITAARASNPTLKVGVLGLGVGNALALLQAGDQARVYEISPQVIQVAGPKALEFTVLKSSPAHCVVVEGDGRFLLERELRQGSQGFDVLLVDAFSGGNIPWHLITLEAFDIYLKHLKPDGLLVINVTNRLPVDRLVLANARVMNLHAALVECPSPENPATLRLSDRHSKYVILGRRGEILSDPGILRAAKAILFPGNSIHKNSVLGPAALECRQRYAEELLGNIHPWTDASNSLSRLVFSR